MASPTFESTAGRERVVAAAIEVFGTYGFRKATIQEIVTAARVSKPLFYRNFKNKEDVFEVVVDRVFTKWREAMVERLAYTEGGSQEALRVLFVAALEYGRNQPLLQRMLTRDSQLLLSTHGDAWGRALAALRELIGSVLRAGVESGEIRTDLPLEHMADLLSEVHLSFANRQILTGDPVSADAAEALATCMVEGVLPRLARSGATERL